MEKQHLVLAFTVMEETPNGSCLSYYGNNTNWFLL